MATFKGEVIGSQRRQDGTWNVKIRVTHNRKVRRISTPWYVTKEQMTKGCKIKDQQILAALDNTIKTYRERLTALGMSATGMDIDMLIREITRERNAEGIPFFPWADEYVRTKKNPGTYNRTLNSLRRYCGIDITFQDITAVMLRGWISSMSGSKSSKTVRDYLISLKHIYNEGKNEFNDEDLGIIRIVNNPFAKIDVPKAMPPRKKALSAEVIRIIAMTYRMKGHTATDIARDAFLLSFCLMGMNAVDLYNYQNTGGGSVEYERSKTRARRADKSFISVDVPECARPLLDVYTVNGRKEKHLLFRYRYADNVNFDNCLRRGLSILTPQILDIYRRLHPRDKRKDAVIAHELNIDPLNFYAARHSWATIARTDLGIDKWTVHEGLNHVDAETKIDDVYLKKDFRNINDANAKVMDYVFGIFTKTADKILGYLEIAYYLCGLISQ